MDVKEFTKNFIRFYKDGFIYLDADSLSFDSNENCLTGFLNPKVPAYRRNEVKDNIIANSESMFCINQIVYAVHFYYYDFYIGGDLKTYSQELLDSYLMVNMNFRYKAHIEANEPIPFKAILELDKVRNGFERARITAYIGKKDNFIITTKGYVVDKKMHNT